MSAPLSPDQLSDLCVEWQRRLGLADWRVSIRYVRGWEISGAEGRCSPEPSRRLALIAVLDPIDYNPANEWPQDVEVTVVHELLHCYHHAGERGSREDLLLEQGVEATARALVALRREAQPPARRRR